MITLNFPFSPLTSPLNYILGLHNIIPQLKSRPVQVYFHLAFIQSGYLPNLFIIISFIIFQHYKASLCFTQFQRFLQYSF